VEIAGHFAMEEMVGAIPQLLGTAGVIPYSLEKDAIKPVLV